jgi:hypothetical protein
MKSILVLTITAVTLIGFAAPTGAAMASGFSGAWPMSLTHTKYGNSTHCLTLTDDGSAGWPHSGPAVLDGKLTGQFQFIDHTIVVTIDDVGAYMNAGSVYASRPSNGGLGEGGFSEVYDGSPLDSGEVVYGAKGGC